MAEYASCPRHDPPVLAGVVVLLGLLAVLAVIVMTRSASRIALGQALRLNED